MSEARVDLEAIRRRAEEAKALAEQAKPPLDTGHSQSCGCQECGNVWLHAQNAQSARLSLPRCVDPLAADVLALCAEVERLRDRNDALRGEAEGAKLHAESVGQSHSIALRLLGEANAKLQALSQAAQSTVDQFAARGNEHEVTELAAALGND